MMKKRLTIFINSPDNYADVFSVFLQCFKLNWKECRYDMVLSTNSLKYSDENIIVYNNYCENDTWMNRTIPVIRQIDTKYILLMCDDSIITHKIDDLLIERILDDMDLLKLDYCKLTGSVKGETIGNSGLLTKVQKNTPYARNLQVGIFNKEYLIGLLGDGSKSPWDLESEWLKEAGRESKEYFQNIVISNTDIMHVRNAVLKGRWYSSALKQLKDMGINVCPERCVIGSVEEKRLQMFEVWGVIIPPQMRPLVKKILKVFGIKFATDN